MGYLFLVAIFLHIVKQRRRGMPQPRWEDAMGRDMDRAGRTREGERQSYGHSTVVIQQYLNRSSPCRAQG